MSAPSVVVHSIPVEGGRKVGRLTLNAESSLNALSADMISALQRQLDAWRTDPSVVAVLLEGAGPKAFCAGGDIRQLYKAMTTPGLMPEAEKFFDAEYDLDHAIHVYPKPVIVWGHGVVMGGGIGLFIGASHRIVTESSKLAMPEITIGLYPDVGTSFVLTKLPGRIGLFLGLTGARLSAADALALGLANHGLPNESKAVLVERLRMIPWSGRGDVDRVVVTELISRLGRSKGFEPGESELVKRLPQIEALMQGESVTEIAARAQAWEGDDQWLKTALDTFLRGSPTSARVIFEQFKRARGLSLEDCFAMDRILSRSCARIGDFKEGIRALLIDKDMKPTWSPARLEEVTPERVEEFFR